MRTATFALENKFYHFVDSIYLRVFKIKRVRNLNLKTIDEQLRNNLITELNRPTVRKRFDEIINEVYKKAILDAERAIKQAYAVDVEPPLPLTEEAIKITQSLGDDIRASILKMLEENKLYTASIPELARAVKDFYGRQRYRAERFARTFVNTVYNNTHIETYRRSGVVQYVQFTAYLDNRTSHICRMMHGTIVEVSKAGAIQPPLHFNCRSRLIPYFGKVREDLLFEERDFTKPVDMRYKRTEEVFDYEKVIEELEKMKGFKATWAIPNFVLDSDIQRRLLKEVGLFVRMKEVENIIDKKLQKEIERAWRETEKDYHERAIGVYEGKIVTWKGEKHSVGKRWHKFLEEVGEKEFKFYHTHPTKSKYDLPLSDGDLAVFLYHENLKEMAAVGRKEIFMVKKTEETIHVKDWKMLVDEMDKRITKLFGEIREEVKDVDKAWREALIRTGKEYAVQFRFKYEVIKR